MEPESGPSIDALYEVIDALLSGGATLTEWTALGGVVVALVVGFLAWRKRKQAGG